MVSGHEPCWGADHADIDQEARLEAEEAARTKSSNIFYLG